jgi:hypothetical protein
MPHAKAGTAAAAELKSTVLPVVLQRTFTSLFNDTQSKRQRCEGLAQSTGGQGQPGVWCVASAATVLLLLVPCMRHSVV